MEEEKLSKKRMELKIIKFDEEESEEDKIDFSPLMDPKKADLLFSKILESIITIGG